MPKNIVIYSDGTGQDGGVRPDQRLSNVYKLYRATRVGPDSAINPAEQIAFYDPGLGTDADASGWISVQKWLGKLLGSIAGRGIAVNITDCYEFILNHWQPGDRILLIGFSRGAYTARCVAQVLSLCGVPTHEPNDPLKSFRRFSRSTRLVADRAVHQVYEHGAGHPREKFEAERDELARRFRVEFGSDSDGVPNAHPHFIGVFDTVAALGAQGFKYYALIAVFAALAAVPAFLIAVTAYFFAETQFWSTFGVLAAATGLLVFIISERGAVRSIDDFPKKGCPRKTHRVRWRASNYDRGLSGRVGYARQAAAIDEDRADFPRVPWGRHTVIRQPIGNEPPPLVQLWFAGNHSDIGGSYPEVESRLSDVSLKWMLDEATSIPGPLIVDHTKLAIWPDASGMQHSEFEATKDKLLWWVPEWAPAWLRNGWAPGARTPSGSPLHPSVYERFAAASVTSVTGKGAYRPPCLADDERVRHFYTDDDFDWSGDASALASLTFRIESNPSVDALMAANNPDLATLLTREGVMAGTIILASNPTEFGQDDYRDALRLTHLDRLIAASGLRSIAVEARNTMDGLLVGAGRLVLGKSSYAALAQCCGVMTMIVIDSSGKLSSAPTFSKATP